MHTLRRSGARARFDVLVAAGYDGFADASFTTEWIGSGVLPAIGLRVRLSHVDIALLGERLQLARSAAGMTQDGLARAVGLDRTAVSRLESGERRLVVTELVAIADALRLPLGYFVDDPVPAVVSRRRGHDLPHGSTWALDTALQLFAADVRSLLRMSLLRPREPSPAGGAPRDHHAAEQLALDVRRRLELDDGPLSDLGAVCEQLGLLVLSLPLGELGPDGACVVVEEGEAGLGVAVINGDAAAGRRRMTLAHELGHWLCGDAYDAGGSSDDERMLSSFAIHLLAPRTGVVRMWREHGEIPERKRALVIAARFRLSWSAAVGHLKNVGLIDAQARRRLEQEKPRRGEYMRMGLFWVEELGAPSLSPSFVAACLEGYATRSLTASRAVELLRGTLDVEDLPQRDELSPEDLGRSFLGHDD